MSNPAGYLPNGKLEKHLESKVHLNSNYDISDMGCDNCKEDLSGSGCIFAVFWTPPLNAVASGVTVDRKFHRSLIYCEDCRASGKSRFDEIANSPNYSSNDIVFISGYLKNSAKGIQLVNTSVMNRSLPEEWDVEV